MKYLIVVLANVIVGRKNVCLILPLIKKYATVNARKIEIAHRDNILIRIVVSVSVYNKNSNVSKIIYGIIKNVSANVSLSTANLTKYLTIRHVIANVSLKNVQKDML